LGIRVFSGGGGSTFTGGSVASALTIPDGSVTAPGLAFTSQTYSGLWRNGTVPTLQAGDPTATTGASVAGKALAITSGNAVASTDTAGAAAGGSVTITSGAAARNASGNAAGGAVNIVTGAGIGTGAYGALNIGTASTAVTVNLIGSSGFVQGSAGTNVHFGAINGGAYFGRTEIFGADSSINGFFGLKTRSTLPIGWSSDDTSYGTGDVFLYRDAAGVLGLRNSTTAQEFRVYNTYTSSTSYEALRTWWSSNNAFLTTDKGSGGGTVRDFSIGTEGASDLKFRVNAGLKWSIDGAGATYALKPFASNSYDLGASASTVRTAYVATSIQGTQTKTLTESSATSFVRIDVSSGSYVAGYVDYAIYANDATDYQIREGQLHFSAVNKAGTETASIGTPTETVAVSAGTLTNTFTSDTSPTNGVNLQANAVSSLTQTTLTISYRVVITSGTATVTGL